MKYHVLEGGKPAVILSEKRNDWNNNVFNTFDEAESYLLHWLGHYAPEVGVVKLNEKYVFEQEHKQYVEIIGVEEEGQRSINMCSPSHSTAKSLSKLKA